jgi:hypothetical protein
MPPEEGNVVSSDRSFYHILMNHEAMRGPGADGDERRLIFSSMSTFAGAGEDDEPVRTDGRERLQHALK